MTVAQTAKSKDGPDQNGNVSFNLTLEPVDGGTAAVPQTAHSAPRQPPQRVFNAGEGKDSPRQHLMRAANLYRLCTDAVDAVIYPAGGGPEDEAWRSAVASLFIESSGRRSDDGQTWWSYIDQMPDKPMKGEPEPF